MCGLWKALSLFSTLCWYRKVKGGGQSAAVNIREVGIFFVSVFTDLIVLHLVQF